MEVERRNPFKGPFPPSIQCKLDPGIAKEIEAFREQSSSLNAVRISKDVLDFVAAMKTKIALLIASNKTLRKFRTSQCGRNCACS